MIRALLALAFLPLAAAGCTESKPDPIALQAAAEFRFNARDVYEAMLMPSCPPVPARRRAPLIAAETEAVRRFEAKAGLGPMRFQLDVARGDVERALSIGENCWADSDPAFSDIHTRMVRERVKGGIEQMERLAPALRSLPRSSGVPVDRGVAFRALTRELVELVNPQCQIDTDAGNDTIAAPARAELARFKQTLNGSPFRLHFDMAEADADYLRSLTSVECIDPSPNVALDSSRYMLEKSRTKIQKLRGMAGI